MANNAYIKLVPKSKKHDITLDDVEDLFEYYKEITNKTGKQLDWKYDDSAFPYRITKINDGNNDLFHLQSEHKQYKSIIVGIGNESIEDMDSKEVRQQQYIQVSLLKQSTHGDKGKANEFCKFLAKKVSGELHLFNGRTIYYY
ncbi:MULTISPECIES: DUF1885 family protein [Bacillaceae]|uniref:DUF1885 family protein n=1 Tax=Bacillaceae TaxID=186817 RepID=UPI001BDF4B60|nr:MULTISPECIES: DUF1885 family protein [Bacillaceae]MDX8359931.1 DUF1885 family protein [Cytobacillus sp. IB215316]